MNKKVVCDQTLRVILTLGGKGTRIAELTGGLVPKGLSRLSRELNHPLIAYQLEVLAKSGLSEVFVSFDEDWQKALFEQSVRIGELPSLKYKVGFHKWDQPLNTFLNEDVLDFVKDSDFIFSYGDLYYSPELIINMIKLAEKNNTSVASMMHSTSSRWKNGEKFTTFERDINNKIQSLTFSERPGFTLHAPYYFQRRAMLSIKEEIESHSPHQITLFKRLIDRNQLSAFRPDFLVNMNTSDRIAVMIDAIKKYRQV